jgi:hypothetical protein
MKLIIILLVGLLLTSIMAFSQTVGKTQTEQYKASIESLRIVNNLDVVTRASNIGYHHVNTELRIDSEGKVKKWMIDWQRVGEYLKSVFTGKTVKDHMTSNYISALNKWNP